MSSNMTGVTAMATILGNDSAETLKGTTSADLIDGNGGSDRLRGGLGRDTFRYDRTSDSNGTTSADVILDFNQGVDKIDLRGIDAVDRWYSPWDNAFKFAGQGTPFSQGEVRYTLLGSGTSEFTLIQANTNDTAAPELHFYLAGHHNLTGSDFYL
jgi:serralysin